MRAFAGSPANGNASAQPRASFRSQVPEFYDGDGAFLVNGRNVPLGTTQAGRRLHDVALPPWAAGPADFVKRHRAALESDHVSKHLHLWIDLVFGRAQRDETRDNLFHPLTYEGAVDLAAEKDDRRRNALELQIDEFGARAATVARRFKNDGAGVLKTPKSADARGTSAFAQAKRP